MESIDFFNRPNNVKNILLADGVTRSGKFLLGKVLSGFNGVEFLQYNSALEQIPYIYGSNNIEENAGIALLKSIVDYSVYDRYLGRNLNMRVSDRSSIFNSPIFDEYLKRQYIDKSDTEVVRYMSSSSIRHLFVTHNILANIDILMKAYTDISVIHIVRNPIDLVYSWYKKGYGKINPEGVLRMNPDINIFDTTLPWFAKDWECSFSELSEVDIVIKLIKSIYDCIDNKLNNLSDLERKQILIIKYEDLILNTDKTIRGIGDFLNITYSSKLDEILVREKCPNTSTIDNHDKKSLLVFKQATTKYAEILKSMEKKYNANIYF